MPEKVRLSLTVNGVEHDVLVEPRTLLLDFLRDELELNGARRLRARRVRRVHRARGRHRDPLVPDLRGPARRR
jgi:hypothetical protein